LVLSVASCDVVRAKIIYDSERQGRSDAESCGHSERLLSAGSRRTFTSVQTHLLPGGVPHKRRDKAHSA